MRVSLPLRVFLMHLAYTLVFTVAAGALVVRLTQNAYRQYAAEWKSQIETFSAEQIFTPVVNEVARSLLTRLENDPRPEVQDAVTARIGEGFNAILRGIRGIRWVVIVGRDRRIKYSNNPKDVDLLWAEFDRELFASTRPVRRTVVEDGVTEYQVMLPVFDTEGEAAGGLRRRLGSVLVAFDRNPETVPKLPELRPPSVKDINVTLPAILFLTALGAGSLLIAAVTSLPVRRLDDALQEYRARGFRGGLNAGRLAERGELASTVRAIQEIGGKLEALDDAGREREALLATLSQALEDGMVAVGPDGAPISWNPAALRILAFGADYGLDGGGADERSAEEVSQPGSAEEIQIREALERNPWLLHGGPARSGGYGTRETEIVRADGSTAPANVTRLPLEVRPGERGDLLLVRDLAALRRVESHLLEASRYAVLAHLAAGLAHEIRNPLHSIGINAEVVEQYLARPWGEGEAREMNDSLESIRDETRRLTSLLNNYLGLVRPKTQREPVDVRELAERVVQLMAYTAGTSGVELKLVGDDGVALVEGVADRLQQAVLNLVLNAIQAMPEGGRVSLEVERRGADVLLHVVDTGPGVPRELRDKLFDMRVTTKPGGTGLGLPLVRMIAESHGGGISYSEAPGSGSEFTLRLPGRAA